MLVTNLLTHITKFVIHVTKFVTKIIYAERKKYHGLRKNYHGGNKKHLRENFDFLLDFPLYVLSIHLHFLTLHIGNRHIYIYKAERLDLHQSGVKCLEGTTERSDGNRGRSPRKWERWTTCQEGSTPDASLVLWPSAFQAHLYMPFLPDTACPVTVAQLRTAFQADSKQIFLYNLP